MAAGRYASGAAHAADWLGAGGVLSNELPGYEHREGQLRMAEAIEDALDGGGTLLVEAGTGTGKTLAYLVPAILSGKRVVVSTGTRTLQDQILDHDLPFLAPHVEALLGRPLRAAAMKGLGNYVCRRRLAEFMASPAADEKRHRETLPLLQNFAETSRTGDRSAAPELSEDDPIWRYVLSGSDTRIGRGCRHFDACFVKAMRERAEEADIVVVNHHLFFADLATRAAAGTDRAALLPRYDALVFDEAHQVEDIATLFFGQEVGTLSLERMADELVRTRGSEAKEMAQALVTATGRFFGALPMGRSRGRVTLHRGDFEGAVEDALFALDDALTRIEEHARRVAADPEAPRSERFGPIARRAQAARDALASVASTPREGSRVAYAEARGRSRVMGTSPVDVSELLRQDVFARGTTVLTSATLTTNGDFAYIRRRLGLNEGDTRKAEADAWDAFDPEAPLELAIEELAVASPFDYPTQAALYLPRAMPDPRDPSYLARAVEEIGGLIELTGGGTFVLCTSLRAMRAFAGELKDELSYPAWIQGDAPKVELLRRFREAGDGVLFATMSFWEGVDVPGDALRSVIIDKLPFAVPSDPLVEARCRAMDERGESSFMRYLVPNAALSLKQGFGRLIRTRRDRGVVTLLDGRVRTKGYGRVFLRSLPEATRCETREEVGEFLERGEAR